MRNCIYMFRIDFAQSNPYRILCGKKYAGLKIVHQRRGWRGWQIWAVGMTNENGLKWIKVGSENGWTKWWCLTLTHNHSCIIVESSHCNLKSSFRCHSDVILQQNTWRNFCDGTTPKRNYLSFLGRFILERDGTKQGLRLTERKGRGQNDPQCLGKGDQTMAKEGPTNRDHQSFPFSFLSFGPPSSFQHRSVSFGKERNIWNDLRTRGGVGQKWADFPWEAKIHR